jgi:hypothetical protein
MIIKAASSLLLATIFLAPALAQAAPRVLKAHCLTVYTANQDSGSVPETDVVLRKGESKVVFSENGMTFTLSYGNAFNQADALQFSATGPTAAEGAAVSLFIGKEFPRRFDLSVNSGFLSCTTK